MAGKPQDRPMVQTERQTEAADGEPLFTEEMSLTDRNGSVGVTIPSGAVKILDYEIGESRRVEVYDDRVVIPKGDSDE
jgi:hypothetical protein